MRTHTRGKGHNKACPQVNTTREYIVAYLPVGCSSLIKLGQQIRITTKEIDLGASRIKKHGR